MTFSIFTEFSPVVDTSLFALHSNPMMAGVPGSQVTILEQLRAQECSYVRANRSLADEIARRETLPCAIETISCVCESFTAQNNTGNALVQALETGSVRLKRLQALLEVDKERCGSAQAAVHAQIALLAERLKDPAPWLLAAEIGLE